MNNTYNSSQKIRATLETLRNARAGFVGVRGYVSTSGRVEPETANWTINAKFTLHAYYKRKIAALREMTLDNVDLSHWVASKGKNSFATPQEQFQFCKDAMIASMEKTLAGDREDAHRQGHDRCHAQVCEGVKVHFLTEKRKEGTFPVLEGGLPIAQSIRIAGLVIAKKVTQPGEYKKVNSGSKVLMDKAIEKTIPFRYVSFTLTEDKYEAVYIDGETV